MKKAYLIFLTLTLSTLSYGEYFNLRPKYFSCKTKVISQSGETKERAQQPNHHIFLKIPSYAVSRARLATPFNWEDREVHYDIKASFKAKGLSWKCLLKKGTIIQNSVQIRLSKKAMIRERLIGAYVNDDQHVEVETTKAYRSRGYTFTTQANVVVTPNGAFKTYSGGYSLFYFNNNKKQESWHYLIEEETDYEILPSNMATVKI